MSSPADIQRGLQAYLQAQALHREKRHAEAAKAYNRALALMPEHPGLLAEFAQLALDVQDWKAAEKLYRRLGELRPKSNFEGHLGVCLFRQDRYADAIPWLETHIARNPGDADVLHALANSLCSTGRWEEGLARARAALELKPDDKKTDAVMNALFHLGRIDELDRMADDAIRRFPDSREVRSMYSLHKLKSGDYDAGFRYFADFRWRNNLKVPDDAGIPGEPWNGEKFEGTLLVVAEQGLGDEIMMSSMLEDIQRMGQRVLVECDARLLPLFTRSFPALSFVPRHQKQLQRVYADGGGTGFRRVNALDLGCFFRRNRQRFPERRHWLQPDPARVAALRDEYRRRWPGRRLIGISWKSTRIMEGGAEKSFRLSDFAPVLQRSDCVFFNLQYGDVAADIAGARAAGIGDIQVDSAIDAGNDIDGLAAQTAALDAVVSTSNTTVHIAGALGVPCLVLLPRTRPVLWYWGYRGDTTPWYPSLHLLRNESEDDRGALMRRAADLLPSLWSTP
ncbi:MAG: tetratricopeptide repeat protein [Pseudomonadota bacterium]